MGSGVPWYVDIGLNYLDSRAFLLAPAVCFSQHARETTGWLVRTKVKVSSMPTLHFEADDVDTYQYMQ